MVFSLSDHLVKLLEKKSISKESFLSLDLSMSSHGNELLLLNGLGNLMVLILSKSIVDRDEDLLSSWELVGSSSESL